MRYQQDAVDHGKYNGKRRQAELRRNTYSPMRYKQDAVEHGKYNGKRRQAKLRRNTYSPKW
jgi:hypothetical protein